jgi:hypothetical protein
MRRVAMAVVLAGCGRLGFDEGVAALSDGRSGDSQLGDSQLGDGSGSSAAPGALVQMSPVTSGAGPFTLTLPAPSQAGTVLVATLAVNSTSSLAYPTGWQQNGTGSVNGACNAVFATNATGMAGVTSVQFTLLAGVPYAAQISEWHMSGIDTGGFGGGQNPTTTLTISTALPAAADNEIAIAMFCEDTTMPAFTPGAGWTSLGSNSNVASSPSLFTEVRSDLPAGTITATATGSLSAKFAAVVFAFTP